MKSYEASATIEASPDAVWKILVDGGHYTDWDSGVIALEGDIALGERLRRADRLVVQHLVQPLRGLGPTDVEPFVEHRDVSTLVLDPIGSRAAGRAECHRSPSPQVSS